MAVMILVTCDITMPTRRKLSNKRPMVFSDIQNQRMESLQCGLMHKSNVADKKSTRLKYGSFFSGLEAPAMGLRNLKVDYEHEFSIEIAKEARVVIGHFFSSTIADGCKEN